MWTAIVCLIVWWIVGCIIGKLLLIVAAGLQMAEHHVLAFIIGAPGLLVLISSILSFPAFLVLLVIKLIEWINV